MNESQTKQILAALLAGETLSPIDALNRFGCFRLGARISELRDGTYNGTRYNIDTISEKNTSGKGAHARYKLVPPGPSHLFQVPNNKPAPNAVNAIRL